MKNILVTGADGQLGNELQVLAKIIANYSFIFTDKDTLDITNLKNLYDYIKNKEISAIINTAAYTNVEKAEEEKEFAYNVNVIGSKNLAQISKEFNLRLIHISTDYVFDGKKSESYLEEDTKNPLSVYGKTKSEGEDVILATYSNVVILRTSWVYSYFGKNFFKTIVNLASKQKEIKIVSDQIGTPTWAKSLAETTLKLIDHSFAGTLHYSNEGVASWYDFAYAIINELQLDCKVIPISTEDYPTRAKRPKFSLLNKTRYHQIFGYENLHWLECVRQLTKEFR